MERRIGGALCAWHPAERAVTIPAGQRQLTTAGVAAANTEQDRNS
jgi:hypothetical protein